MCQFLILTVLQLLSLNFLLSNGNPSVIHRRTKRIAVNDLGGAAAKNVPYLVELHYKDSFGEHFLCSGTLIHPQFVVTAAHCVSRIGMDVLVVKRSLRGGDSRGIDEISTPQAYGEHFKSYDVAVIKMSSPLTVASELIRPIGLGECELKEGDRLQVSGYRRRLQNTSFMPWKQCSKRFAGNLKISKTMFCGVPEERAMTCSNDAGGPVVHDGKLCGITLWSEGWFDSKSPEAYLSINAVRRFIEEASNLSE